MNIKNKGFAWLPMLVIAGLVILTGGVYLYGRSQSRLPAAMPYQPATSTQTQGLCVGCDGYPVPTSSMASSSNASTSSAENTSQPPLLSAIMPSSGSYDTRVIISGKGLTPTGNDLYVFGKLVSSNLSSYDDDFGSSIYYTITSAQPGVNPVYVRNANGQSNVLSYYFEDQISTPVIESLSSNPVPAGAHLIIKGSGFDPLVTVTLTPLDVSDNNLFGGGEESTNNSIDFMVPTVEPGNYLLRVNNNSSYGANEQWQSDPVPLTIIVGTMFNRGY